MLARYTFNDERVYVEKTLGTTAINNVFTVKLSEYL